LKLFVLALALSGIAPLAIGGPSGPDVPTFHRDPQRTGWDQVERTLTPKNVSGGTFGALWQSPEFDPLEGRPARLYASPLYVDQVQIADEGIAKQPLSVVFAASSNGFVYAVSAFDKGSVSAGTILWKAKLGKPCYPGFDGLNMGVLSTPVIDLNRKVLYVVTCEEHYVWKAYALEIGSGHVLPGWPVSMDATSLLQQGVPQNFEVAAANGPANRPFLGAQRGALNLNAEGSHLYVTFGESLAGWVVALDTAKAAVLSAFATVASPHNYAGGVWGAAGVSIEASGHVVFATGTSFGGLKVQPHEWVQSVLELSDSGNKGFELRGTYTPFNYCLTAANDVDLGSGGVTIIPPLDRNTTATTSLLAVGGKQGNVYLLNGAHLPGKLDERQACSEDSTQDKSLLSPQPQPQFQKPGPLNVFGPYTETKAMIDQARSRSVPAYFHASNDAHYLFVTGQSKADLDSSTNVPPCLARLKIVLQPKKPAFLKLDQLEQTLVFENPGSPVVTSNGSANAIVWILDENARRTASLNTEHLPQPVLYAVDALTLKPIWRSQAGELHASGKYNEPTIARGVVFVGTDRIEAFGLKGRSGGS
jgi:hypothetical protein